MATTYTDQFFQLDPYAPPTAGVGISPVKLDLVDQNDDGIISNTDTFGDTLDGTAITAIWVGDTVTYVPTNSSQSVTVIGTTFYLSDGRRFFTPNDGSVLQDGTFLSATYVTNVDVFPVALLGPPCFTAGTLIDTPAGPVPVEDLRPGDLVVTRDHGARPLRWVGRRTVAGYGKFAPVTIEPGIFDNDIPLVVSPEHRILYRGWQVQLWFAEDETLVAARHLVGLPGIRRKQMPRVTYYHLLFERHEIVRSNGAWSESLHPGGWLIEQDESLRTEIAALFPEILCSETQALPAARRVLTAREASILRDLPERFAGTGFPANRLAMP